MSTVTAINVPAKRFHSPLPLGRADALRLLGRGALGDHVAE
jgi:hypothetical protein